MSLATLREELRQARASAAAGDTEAAVRKLDQALRQLEPESLLTVNEAADHLGLRSTEIVKYWVRSGFLLGTTHDGQIRIPISEVERIADSERVHQVRLSDALHDASADLGDDAGMSDEEMLALEASRPGTLPWQR